MKLNTSRQKKFNSKFLENHWKSWKVCTAGFRAAECMTNSYYRLDKLLRLLTPMSETLIFKETRNTPCENLFSFILNFANPNFERNFWRCSELRMGRSSQDENALALFRNSFPDLQPCNRPCFRPRKEADKENRKKLQIRNQGIKMNCSTFYHCSPTFIATCRKDDGIGHVVVAKSLTSAWMVLDRIARDRALSNSKLKKR